MKFSNRRQNTYQNLARLSAQRYLYSRVKSLIALQYGLAFIVSVLGLLGAQIIGPLASLASFSFVFLDRFFIDRSIRAGQREAALIQEDFDCDVLELEWSDTKCGSAVPMEDVYRLSNKMKGTVQSQSLKNWYPSAAFSLPAHLGRIVCQRANVVWNLSGRKRLIKTLTAFFIFCVLALVVSMFVFKMNTEEWFLLVLLPLVPLINRLGDLYFKVQDSIGRLTFLQKRIHDIWKSAESGSADPASLKEISREFQNELFDFRSRELPNFDFLYWSMRAQDEGAMDKTAKSFIKKKTKDPKEILKQEEVF